MEIDIGPVGIWDISRRWMAAEDLADAAAEIEALGYGAAWLNDSAGDLELPRKLLSVTRDLVVVTAIINVWTNPAAEVAAAYAALEADHPERLLVGLGSSHRPLVEKAGYRYERPLQRLTAYLDELDSLTPTVPSDRRVLAALGPRALGLAARRSLGAHPYLVTPEYTRRAREAIGPGVLLAVEQKVVLESDPRRARAIARARLAQYMALPNYTKNLLRLGFSPEDFDSGGSDRLVDALVAWGDTDTVIGRIAEHHESGADHVATQVLTSPDPKPTDPLPRAEWRTLAAAGRWDAVRM